MKDQGATMMAAATKFQDSEPVEEDGDDDSSFEEVQRPAERTSAVKPAVAEKSKEEPTLAASTACRDPDGPAAKAAESPKASLRDSISSFYADMVQTIVPDLKSPKLAGDDPGSATDDVSSQSMEREMKNMKAMMAQQSRQLSSLTQTLTELVAEVKALKGS
jgi:coronin-1B/1C/6